MIRCVYLCGKGSKGVHVEVGSAQGVARARVYSVGAKAAARVLLSQRVPVVFD